MQGLENYAKILAGRKNPAFFTAKNSGELKEKILAAEKVMQECVFCERKCKVNRIAGEKGRCACSDTPRVFGAQMHFGEEPELVPSATLFFSGCSMKCEYCQNAPQSLDAESGREWSVGEIAEWIEIMYKKGCKNVNFVGGDPAPHTLHILKALSQCSAPVPVVWNSNAYYSEKTAELLNGIIDVYLLDFRYFSNSCAEKYSHAPNYVEAAKRNFLNAANDSELLVRLLVLPSHSECCAKPILEWLAENIGLNVRLNILKQYRPAFNAFKFPEINRFPSEKEFFEVMSFAEKLGFKNIV